MTFLEGGPLQFVHVNDPILETASRQLSLKEINDPKTQAFFDAMLTFARGEQDDLEKRVLVGLAAPQVGKDIRLIVVDICANGKGQTGQLCLYVNPEIVTFSHETEQWYEACYSTGNVKGIVTRPSRIELKALDRDGKEICEKHQGYVARIFQHEIDHLNGIRFPQRMHDHEKLHLVKEEEMSAYRNEAGWRDWKTTVPKSQWKQYM
jgi:peptide deformylase